MKQLFYILIFVLISLNAYSADRETKTNGNWTTATIWVGSNIPISADNAIINNNHDITISSSDVTTIEELTMWNNSSLTIDGDLTIDSLHINNRADLFVNGTLTILGGVTMSNNSVLNVDVNGDVDVQGDFTAGNNVDLIVDGTIDIDGDLTAGNGTTLDGTGTVTVTGDVSGDEGFVGDSQINTLPIKLLSFNVFNNNNQIIINWVTASEINNDYFSIERSVDGVSFEIIDIVNGAGNSNNVLNYETIDNKPLQGTSYYRLKQTDYDGKFEYSSLVAVKVHKEVISQAMNVYPNPVLKNSQNVNVKINGFNENEEVYVKVINIFGKVEYFDKIYSGFDGAIDLSLDAGIFNSLGYHIISVSSSNKSFNNRFLVK
ncbi:MAG: hypothetical protein DRJ01_09645 [Bacteroidetes bacterium]|nr:MAG: hypothetical protein DRJ01_09645 [Bacteroidota bacterium]